ncbi:MAG: hypothetical protein NTU73_06275, partial [Ignavibacteriae bacterium]|nr:hypothetical protein [Ignavibacteriota bacterium]
MNKEEVKFIRCFDIHRKFSLDSLKKAGKTILNAIKKQSEKTADKWITPKYLLINRNDIMILCLYSEVCKFSTLDEYYNRARQEPRFLYDESVEDMERREKVREQIKQTKEIIIFPDLINDILKVSGFDLKIIVEIKRKKLLVVGDMEDEIKK